MFIEKLNYLYRETKLNDSKMSKNFLASLEKKKKMRKKIKKKKLNAYALLLNRSELCAYAILTRNYNIINNYN